MADGVLLFDIGNSRIKAGLFAAGHLLRDGADVSPNKLVELVASWTDAPVERLGIAVTGRDGAAQALAARLAQAFPGIDPDFARSEARWGRLRNAYDDPATMGVDRWLALIGAWSTVAGACLVLDAGTALTADAIDDDGNHLGGWIVPGVRLMQASLASDTARVGQHVTHAAKPWGRTTGECVSRGSAEAVAAAAAASVKRFLDDFPQGHIFLTGGDRDCLENGIRELTDSVTIDAALVLRGFARRIAGKSHS